MPNQRKASAWNEFVKKYFPRRYASLRSSYVEKYDVSKLNRSQHTAIFTVVIRVLSRRYQAKKLEKSNMTQKEIAQKLEDAKQPPKAVIEQMSRSSLSRRTIMASAKKVGVKVVASRMTKIKAALSRQIETNEKFLDEVKELKTDLKNVSTSSPEHPQAVQALDLIAEEQKKVNEEIVDLTKKMQIVEEVEEELQPKDDESSSGDEDYDSEPEQKAETKPRILARKEASRLKAKSRNDPERLVFEKYQSHNLLRKTDDAKCWKAGVACRLSRKGKPDLVCAQGNRYQVKVGKAKQTCKGEQAQQLVYVLRPDGCQVINRRDMERYQNDHPDATFSETCPSFTSQLYEQKDGKRVFKDQTSIYPRVTNKTQAKTRFRGKDDILTHTPVDKQTKEALMSYTEDNFERINSLMRNNFSRMEYLGEEITDLEDKQYTLKQINLLDKLFRRDAPTFLTPHIVFRGTASMTEEDVKGKEIVVTKVSFLSTSTNEKVAAEFANGDREDGKYGVILQLKVPAGTPYIDASNINFGRGLDEEEILLPRGLTLRIHGKKAFTARIKRKKSFKEYCIVPTTVTFEVNGAIPETLE